MVQNPERAFFTLVCIAGISLLTAISEAALDVERLTIGGEVRERYEFRDDADFNAKADDTLSFVGSRIRLHAGYEVTPDIVIFFQIQDSRLFGSGSIYCLQRTKPGSASGLPSGEKPGDLDADPGPAGNGLWGS
jgi:hypothetical protein